MIVVFPDHTHLLFQTKHLFYLHLELFLQEHFIIVFIYLSNTPFACIMEKNQFEITNLTHFEVRMQVVYSQLKHVQFIVIVTK